MNSSSNRASNPAGKARRKDVNHSLETARQMLPLIRGIVTDIVDTAQRLERLTPEQQTLEEHRRLLTWASRERRYAVRDEIEKAEKELAGAEAELDALGVAVADRAAGRVDFPTRINGRAAAFSWQLGEEAVGFWRYSGEPLRRPIPADWMPNTALRGRAEP